MDLASDELVTIRQKGIGPITGMNYSELGEYLWYRHGTADGIPTIEMFGIHRGENTATDVTPPDGDGWTPYVNSDGEASRYISDTAFINSDTKVDKAQKGEGGGFYQADPNLKQWWPIPETSIVNSQGSLVNDYAY